MSPSKQVSWSWCASVALMALQDVMIARCHESGYRISELQGFQIEAAPCVRNISSPALSCGHGNGTVTALVVGRLQRALQLTRCDFRDSLYRAAAVSIIFTRGDEGCENLNWFQVNAV